MILSELFLFVICNRCLRVSRSWTTVFCWACTSWTTERGASRVRQGVMGGDPWLRGCFTPPPWSPFKETARLLKPSPLMTREFIQPGRAKHTHAHAHLLCLSPDVHFFPRRRYTTFHRTLEHTVGLSHNHSYKNTNTVLHIYSNTHTQM